MGDEHPHRSIVKAITYRVGDFLLIGGILYIFTGNVGESLVVSLVYQALETGFYYIHERLWFKINWGSR